jgi:hypothetical protein
MAFGSSGAPDCPINTEGITKACMPAIEGDTLPQISLHIEAESLFNPEHAFITLTVDDGHQRYPRWCSSDCMGS